MQPETVRHSQEQSIWVQIPAPLLTQLYDLEKVKVSPLNLAARTLSSREEIKRIFSVDSEEERPRDLPNGADNHTACRAHL